MPTVTPAQYGEDRIADIGGRTLAANAVERLRAGGTVNKPTKRASRASADRWPWVMRHRSLLIDVSAVLVGVLDVWLGHSWHKDAPTYSFVLSGVAAAALVLRRRFPFTTLLLTIPGFFAGWSELAAMIALATLSRRHILGWQTLTGVALVWVARFFWWPPEKFFAADWEQHVHNAIYAFLVAGLPLAIALLAHARQELSTRIAELAESRERERMLHAHAIRADERARLAREMHDVVSHQVSLIAMQAGALRIAAVDPNAKQVAGTIRMLSTRTLDELRQLVSVLRTTSGDDSPQPGVDELPQLVATAGINATLTIQGPVRDISAAIAGAVYRTVQETLTNIRKHASGASASVCVITDTEVLRVEVRNGPSPASTTPALPGGGHGLVGLRERADLLNGTFDAGPTDEGGFRVRVTFPLTRTLDG